MTLTRLYFNRMFFLYLSKHAIYLLPLIFTGTPFHIPIESLFEIKLHLLLGSLQIVKLILSITITRLIVYTGS